MAEPDLGWIEDVAREIDRHPMTIRRWMRRGLIKRYKKELDRRVYVDRTEVRRLLDDPPVSERP